MTQAEENNSHNLEVLKLNSIFETEQFLCHSSLKGYDKDFISDLGIGKIYIVKNAVFNALSYERSFFSIRFGGEHYG